MLNNKQKNKEEIEIKDFIAYIRSMKSLYKISANNNGIQHNFYKTKKLKKELQTDFFIPYTNYGKVFDSYGLFDNFKFSKFGKFNKFVTSLTIFFLVISIFYLPKVIFFYAFIYIILFIMYMFYKKNKNYVRTEILIDNEVDSIIYQFKNYDEKMLFIKNLKKYNNNFLKIKTDLSYTVNNSFVKKIWNSNEKK